MEVCGKYCANIRLIIKGILLDIWEMGEDLPFCVYRDWKTLVWLPHYFF